MKSKFLKKIIAVAVVGTSISTFVSPNAFAVGTNDFYAWQNMNSGQSNGIWKLNSGKWYFYNYSGTMQTGWIYDKGKWYYADYTGVMQTGVIQINGKIHLFSESGAMQTGNAVINGKYYSFDGNGVAAGKDIPTPVNTFDLSGSTTIPYTPKMITNEDSSPSNPNTVARDPDNLIKYNVKFKDDDGDEFSTKTIEKDEKLTLYKPSKSGYTFVEWTTKKDGDGDSYEAGESITIKKDITLYAQWKESSTSDPDTSTENILVQDITVTSTAGTITTKAGTLQMIAKVLPIDATQSGVTWSVSDSKIATISSSGLLTAVSNGTVSVVATANDTSKVVIKTSIAISGQANSGSTTPDSGTTTPVTGGTITAFDPSIKLDDVAINTEGNIVDLPLLKSSGKLPTKAKVTCSLIGNKVEEIEVGIKDWTGTFDGTVEKLDGYTLNAVLGNLPTGYTNTASFPSPKLKVIVQTKQTDDRKDITGAVSIPDIILDSDKHIMTTELLNASVGMLPKTVTLNYAGGTVDANVKTWNCTNDDVSASVFDGSIGTKNLVAEIETPVGYKIASGVIVKALLKVNTKQNANIQEIVGVVKNADIVDESKKLKLNYALNDKLDLSNLTVNVKYNNGNDGTISYVDFKDNNIGTGNYFQGIPLSTISTFNIPVEFNGKIVYTEKIIVSQAVGPTLTASGTIIYDNTLSASNNDMTFKYTLGTGSKKTKEIKALTLGGTPLTLDTGTNNGDYTINTGTNTLTIKKGKLASFISGKSTPSNYALKATFTPEQGTVEPTSSINIGFISIPDAPNAITLESNAIDVTKVPAKNNTIKVSGLVTNVKYQYCVVDSTATTSVESGFKDILSTDGTITDTSFADGKKLYIRVKAVSITGATNPPSAPTAAIPIKAENIGKTKSSEKSITNFDLKDSNNTYKGTITEGTSSGVITVVVPATVAVTSLIASPTYSAGATISVTTTDFTNPVKYTVTAEDGTTKRDYTVNVVKPMPQHSVIRQDKLTLTIPEDVTSTNGTTTTTTTKDTQVPIDFMYVYNNGTSINYSDGGTMKTVLIHGAKIGIDRTVDGTVGITLPGTFDTFQQEALDNIKEKTLYVKDRSIAYVGIELTNSNNAASVKVAKSFNDLMNGTNITTIQLSSDGENVSSKQYLEQIPVANYGVVSGTPWSKVTSSTTTKYYAWLDIKGNILGYTTLTINVV